MTERGCEKCGRPGRHWVFGTACQEHEEDVCHAFSTRKKVQPDPKRIYRLPFGALLTVRRDPLRIELLCKSNEDQFQRERREAKARWTA